MSELLAFIALFDNVFGVLWNATDAKVIDGLSLASLAWSALHIIQIGKAHMSILVRV